MIHEDCVCVQERKRGASHRIFFIFRRCWQTLKQMLEAELMATINFFVESKQVYLVQ
jgi:hypothetical protein